MAWRRITLLVEAVVDGDGEIPEISCGSDIACLEDLAGSVAITKIQDVRIKRREAQSLMSIHGVHPDLFPTPSWGLFEANRERPEIQKVDEDDPDDQVDDLDAAVSFVHALEHGEPEALTAAEVFLSFYSGVEHEPGKWEP